jgi:hypothetical protein
LKSKTAKSIGDVMTIVKDARAEWKLSIDKEIWFRGEDAKHRQSTLQPKLYRHLPSTSQLVSKNILEEEHYLHEEFEHCGIQLYDHDDVDDWDWYFLMQHHGAPTRLLDWSDGALMGTHFAVSGNLVSSRGGFIYVLDCYQLLEAIEDLPEIKAHIKAWAAYRRFRRKKQKSWPSEWDQVYIPGMHSFSSHRTRPSKASGHKRIRRPDLPEPPLVLEFPHITRRVAAQRSRFMVYGRDKNWLARWATKADSHIWRIFIPKSKIPGIRVQLRDAGITESVIFPDLDGLGRELDQLWNIVKTRRSLSN